MLSSSWAWILYFSFSFLLTKLKEKRLENLSVIQRPGKNSGLRRKRWENPVRFVVRVNEMALCYGMLWTLTFFFFFYLFFLILYFFSFKFLFFSSLVTMKRHVTSQSHDMSHDVTS